MAGKTMWILVLLLQSFLKSEFISVMLLLTPTTIAGVKRSAASVCLYVRVSVCPQHNSKTNDQKSSNLVWRMNSGSTSFMIFRSKGQRSRSQGQKMQNILKAIEWRCEFARLYFLVVIISGPHYNDVSRKYNTIQYKMKPYIVQGTNRKNND